MQDGLPRGCDGQLERLWPTALGPILHQLELQPRRRGSYFVVRCLGCDKRRAWVQNIVGRAPRVTCNRRGSCGFKALVFDLLADRLGSRRAAYQEIERLAGASCTNTATQPALKRTASDDRPPKAELAALFASCGYFEPPSRRHRRTDASARAARELLRSKGCEPGDVDAFGLAKLVAPDGPSFPWWPRRWRRDYPILVPAYDARGRLVSVHARRAGSDNGPKTRWPVDHSARALLFAPPLGRLFLRGKRALRAELDGVLIVEGLTDSLSASLFAIRLASRGGYRLAVLGVTSGSISALADIDWPPDLPAIVATDRDGAGAAYAERIREALPHVPMYRNTEVRRG